MVVGGCLCSALVILPVEVGSSGGRRHERTVAEGLRRQKEKKDQADRGEGVGHVVVMATESFLSPLQTVLSLWLSFT